MDNVTHTLAGLLIAESAVRLHARWTGAEPSARFRTVAAVTSVVAANLPDADLFYTGVGGDRLTYMLHHRGHTHTVLVALPVAALLWGAAMLAWRWRARAAPPRGEAYRLLRLLLVSTLSHLVLDWTNSYGVHPFWPVDNRWRYGDAVFIIEPWFWVLTVPALVAAATSRIGRGLLSLVLVIGLVLAWSVPLVSAGAAAALTAGAAGSIALARILRPGPRAATAVALWVAVTLVMATASAVVREAAVRAVRAADPAAELLDVVVTPLPANPVCALVITVERSGTLVRVSTARVSSVPGVTAASHCPGQDRSGLAPEPSRRSTPEVAWDSEWTAPHAELATLARASCPAMAALRFIRVPVWRADGDSTVVLGDARFGGVSANALFTVQVPRRAATCPDAVPSWTPPRADLLGL